jgi:hypothetical protein
MRRDYPAWAAATDRVLERPGATRVLADEGLDIP